MSTHRRCLMMRILISLLAIGISAQRVTAQSADPVANSKAVVISGDVRFTVLTPQMIRMEWSANREFEDRASLVFINRRMPVPGFAVFSDGGWLVINTGKLTLRYLKGSGEFTSRNLSVSFECNEKKTTWQPGESDSGNLLGTTRTLDGVKGEIGLDQGLLSRNGWTLIDDSDRPLFNKSEWQWVQARPEGARQDWYLFAYGRDYKKELGDYVKVAGRIPMPPRYAFGDWWSRYWAYTDEELKNLVDQFGVYGIPLDVLVVDMDWHQTFDLRWSRSVLDQAGQTKGWTGYTWDKVLFPDPDEFMRWCKERGLKLTFNLHPAAGIQPWEDHYPEMAKSMGIDPATNRYVPFDITDKKFAENYFKLIIDPLERKGVDFWWMDWQQWDTTRIRGLNPTWWINYAFYTHMQRENSERPIILSRWGGLGDQRYEIGFSGDVITDWSSLQFQPYFTYTAANVCFGYWSHDIGGHIPGTVSPELYTRWVQWGALSPIFRTHTTRNANSERRIWAYPYDYFSAMKKAVELRRSLMPYIYTAARGAYDSGVSMLHPLYYDYPERDEAYTCVDQYMFGDDIMVAPVVSAMSGDTLLAYRKIWVPPGTWIEWYSGRKFSGPGWIARRFAIDEIPIYVKYGSVIPMTTQESLSNSFNRISLNVFPSASGSGRLYQDAGNSDAYIRGEYSWTDFRYARADDNTLRFVIEPTTGHYNGMPPVVDYQIRFMNVLPVVSVSGAGHAASLSYDGDNMSATVTIPRVSVHERIAVSMKFAGSLEDERLFGVTGKIERLKESMNILNHLWPEDWSPDSLIVAAQTGDRMSLYPGTAPAELTRFYAILPLLKSQIDSLKGDRSTIVKALVRLEGTISK